ncbi:hypothetical protein N431DRAFT_82491 [Stipitochalara longipes BDJ]|nr:hypothetical protein N431DRAFT_82491 [Stipitochalara longipes BDJ]
MADSRPAAVDAQPDLSTVPKEATQTESAQLLDPGPSSQEPLAHPHPAPKVVQPHRDDEEGTTIETERLLSDDDLHVSPPVANAPGPGNGSASDSSATEDLVTLPLATLQQLVRYCAQLVNESKELKTRIPDLERDGISNNEQVPGDDPHVDTDTRKPPNFFNLNDMELECISDDILNRTEEIWRQVVPWQLRNIPVLSDEMIEQEEPMLARCRTIDDIHLLFRSPHYELSQRSEVSACLQLRHNIKIWERSEDRIWPPVLLVPPLTPLNYGLIVVFITGMRYERLCIGSILERYYQMRVLSQPDNFEPRNYLDHIWFVVLVLLFLNATFRLGWEFEPETISDMSFLARAYVATIFTRRKSLEEVLGLNLHQLCRILHATQQSSRKDTPPEAASGPIFRVSDLNIESLSSIGGLTIEWTPYLEDHLRLDIKNTTLHVIWSDLIDPTGIRKSLFGYFEKMLLENLPPEYVGASANIPLEIFKLHSDILLSWNLLFTTGGVSTKKNMANYDRIPKPPWVTGDDGDYQKSKHLSFDRSLTSAERKEEKHMVLKSYSEFTVFENRIRQLVYYMDTQKPQGFRQLWRDKRDTLSYYTFWGVIIFGSLSIFLALFSLAVSIAQTVAGFRALNLGPSPPAPSR